MKLKGKELMDAPLSNLYAIRELQLVLDDLKLHKDYKVIEIGPGNGLASLILSKYVEKVVGIDISESLIKFLSEISKPDNVEFHVMDATKEPPKDFLNNFDLVICADVMEHVEKPERLLRFITKILRQGGSLSMTFPINNFQHGRNCFMVDDVYNLFSGITELKSNVKIVELSRFSSLLDRFYNNVQKSIKPAREADNFEETVCFEIINNPSKFNYFIKIVTILLFKISQNAYRQNRSGNRAFIYAVKV